MLDHPTIPARLSWIGLMTAASATVSFALACATPFPALAALAAMFARRRDGLLLIAAAWAVAQVVGFGVKGHPLDGTALFWPVALACAATGALFAAEGVTRALANVHPALRMGGGYLAAYAGFKLIVLVGVNLSDHGWAAFSAEVMIRQLTRDGVILLGLTALHLAWTRVGANRAPAAARAA